MYVTKCTYSLMLRTTLNVHLVYVHWLSLCVLWKLVCYLVGLSNIYSYTRCSYATNIFTLTIKFSIKNLLAKTRSSSPRKKHRRAKKKYPHSCTMRASSYPGLATGSREHHSFHIQSALQLLVHHLSCTRAGPPHTPLVIDALGSWQIRASFLQAYNCNLSTGH